ncbi:MAG: NADH-quinone oxidoreductase subunit M [Chloroflexi bacterium]|nr:NADH-quinone oxidoreductase subunit M [Chloroflexota bacterium]
MLTTLIALPLVGAAAVFLLRSGAARWTALGFALVELVLAVVVASGFDPALGTYQFVENVPWVPLYGISYAVGVDGISLWLMVLAAFLTPLAVVARWPSEEPRDHIFYSGLLALCGAMVGAFAATDVILFFLFWEVMLIPAYALIGVFGGDRRIAAAIKFFIYTAAGSLLMLAGIIALYVHGAAAGPMTFAMEDMARVARGVVPFWIFLVFVLAFAIKVPVVPLHTWLPDAYAQSPIPLLVLATTLTKVGAYGFVRFIVPMFPAELALNTGWLSALAVLGILYGAICAIGSRDLVRLLAYSSISHLGFIVLGILALNTQGVMGGVLQMVNHGISAAALFIIADMLIRRTGTSDIISLGGLASRYPLITAFFLLAVFSAAGVPGLNGFTGEFLTMLGAFEPRQRFVVVASAGVILGAAYLIWMFQRMMHGPVKSQRVVDQRDLTRREALLLAPLAIAIVVIGVAPNILLVPMQESVVAALGSVRTAASDQGALIAMLGAAFA